MGGKKATSTSQVTIPPEVLARYNAVNARAETAASKPFQAFGSNPADYVAQMNQQQALGTSTINNSGGPAYAGIDKYMTPYTKNVADTTGAYMRQQQEQAQSGALGTAAMSGAFGGDRAGIAAANLQQQNSMAYGKTMADIMNQGYTQALGASQADLNRGLQAGQTQLAAGTMQQQTEQAGKDAMINRFMQEQGLPYQQAQFLANIALGTGAASGSTTTSTTPVGFFQNLATGGKVDGYAEGGGVAGPVSHSKEAIGGVGYVPEPNLPIGQLMIAQPPEQSQDSGGDKIAQILAMIGGGGKKDGGAIGSRHGYATDGGVEETRGEQIARLSKLPYKALTNSLPNAALALGAHTLSAVPQALSFGLGAAQMPEASDLMNKVSKNIWDYGSERSRQADDFTDHNLITGPDASRFVQPTESQRVALDAIKNAKQSNMDYQPSVTDSGGFFPSNYGLAMAKGPAAAGWLPSTAPSAPTSLGGLEGGARAETQPANLGVSAVQQPTSLTMADTAAPLSMGATLGSPSQDTSVSTMGKKGVAGSDRQNPVLVGNIMTPAPKGSGFDIDRLAASVRWQESGSPSGNYGAIGQPVDRGNGNVDYAYGAYQIMGANIPQWTQEVLGKSMTPEEFVRDPQAQDIVAKAKLAQYYQKYGSAEDVASAWFSGRPLNGNNSVDGASGKSVPSYVSDVMNKYYNGGEGSGVNYDIGQFSGVAGNSNASPNGGGLAAGTFGNDKPYEERNALGKFFYKPEGGLDRNSVLSALSGLGAMASSRSMSPFTAALQGLGAGADTYKGLLKQNADINFTNQQAAQAQALTQQTQVQTANARFSVGPDGMPQVIMPDGSRVDFYTFKDSEELQAMLGSAKTAEIVRAAEEAGVNQAAASPDAGIYQTPEMQKVYDSEMNTLRTLGGDRTKSNEIVNNIDSAAAAAGGNMRANTFMQLNAFAGLNGNPAALGGGYQAALRANAAKALNLVGAMVGLGGDSGFAAETDIIKKAASILGTEAARNLDQGTLGALQEILNGLPNADQDPKASAKLMASIIQGQQRAIDLKTWNDGYIDRANGNQTLTAFNSEAEFNRRTAQIYEQEKPFLETLVLKGGDPAMVDPSTGMTPVQLLTSGQLTQQETKDVLSQLFPSGYPPHLVTTFSR